MTQRTTALSLAPSVVAESSFGGGGVSGAMVLGGGSGHGSGHGSHGGRGRGRGSGDRSVWNHRARRHDDVNSMPLGSRYGTALAHDAAGTAVCFARGRLWVWSSLWQQWLPAVASPQW